MPALSGVLQLVRGRAGSPTLVAPGPAPSPAAGGKKQGGGFLFLTHGTTQQMRCGEQGADIILFYNFRQERNTFSLNRMTNKSFKYLSDPI